MGHLNNIYHDGKLVDLKLPFPWKLHKLLEESEANRTTDIVSWLPDGKSFKVYDTKSFTDKIMPSYFSQTKYNSFRRQCYIYGFRLRRDGAFNHPRFQRDDLQGSMSLKRNQEGDRRKKNGSPSSSYLEYKPHNFDGFNHQRQRSLPSFALAAAPPLPVGNHTSYSPPKPQTVNDYSNAPHSSSALEYSRAILDPLSDQEEIKDLAFNIFENSQYFNEPFSNVINLDFTFLDTDLDSLEDVFRSEVQSTQPITQQTPRERPPETIAYTQTVAL